jgi:hypothetical protein
VLSCQPAESKAFYFEFREAFCKLLVLLPEESCKNASATVLGLRDSSFVVRFRAMI